MNGQPNKKISSKQHRSDENMIGTYLPLGLCFGLLFGQLFNNLALGLSLGLCFGVAIGAATKKQ
ncbi:hypothetical protein SDC9_175334 [bioreactor metagenome]|uniref:Glycine zipper-like domain-containing protein n=1 Tax=bioreactor metagenome TaxID=1076179 RepID=A0A645GNX6_9ZZZZ|nr:hypothetical protein [Erysipelotrichaceae bacterium]